MSLAELSVSMMISGGLAVLIAALVIVTFRQSSTEISRVPQQASAQDAVDTMSRAIRATIVPAGETRAILTATPTALTLYAQLNRPDSLVVDGLTVPSKVEFYVSGTCLYRAITPARLPAYASGTSVYAWDTGRVAICLARTSRPPTQLFGYYTSSTASTALTNTSAGLAAATAATVRSVQLTLQLTEPRTGVLSSVVDTRVGLANLVAADGS